MLRLRGSNDAAGVGVPPGRVALGVESLRVKIPVRGTISTGEQRKTTISTGEKRFGKRGKQNGSHAFCWGDV